MSMEQRIRQQRKQMRGYAHSYGTGAMWLWLAQRWKLPVREIKRICGVDLELLPAKKQRYERSQADRAQHLAEVHKLMDAGRIDEARALFDQTLLI